MLLNQGAKKADSLVLNQPSLSQQIAIQIVLPSMIPYLLCIRYKLFPKEGKAGSIESSIRSQDVSVSIKRTNERTVTDIETESKSEIET